MIEQRSRDCKHAPCMGMAGYTHVSVYSLTAARILSASIKHTNTVARTLLFVKCAASARHSVSVLY